MSVEVDVAVQKLEAAHRVARIASARGEDLAERGSRLAAKL